MSQESCDSLHRHCQKKIKKKNPLKTEHGEYQELVWVFIPFCMFRKKQMETMSTYIILHSLVDCRLISAISMERSSCWGQLTTHQNWFTSWKTPSKHHHFNAWFKGKSAKQKVFPVRGVATERKRVVEPRSLTSFNAADEESFSQLFFAKNPGVNVDWRPNQRVTSETSMASFGDITGLPSGIHMAWSSLPSSDDLRSWATVCKPAMELIYAPNVQNILSNIRFEHGMQNVLINTVGLKRGTITEFPAWDGISLHSLGRPVPNQLGIAFGSSEAPSPLSCLHRRSTIRVSQDFPTTG